MTTGIADTIANPIYYGRATDPIYKVTDCARTRLSKHFLHARALFLHLRLLMPQLLSSMLLLCNVCMQAPGMTRSTTRTGRTGTFLRTRLILVAQATCSLRCGTRLQTWCCRRTCSGAHHCVAVAVEQPLALPRCSINLCDCVLSTWPATHQGRHRTNFWVSAKLLRKPTLVPCSRWAIAHMRTTQTTSAIPHHTRMASIGMVPATASTVRRWRWLCGLKNGWRVKSATHSTSIRCARARAWSFLRRGRTYSV